jgi:hypothetical protein
MDQLTEWAKRWGVPPEALSELWRMSLDVEHGETTPEAKVQSSVRLEAAQKGYFLYRNNRGAGTLTNGSHVRWGLCNESKKVGDEWKSADLIGWRPYFCYTGARGWHQVAQFVSVEVKAGAWRFSGTREEIAQSKWAALVNAHGGFATLVNSTGKL